MSRAVTPRKGPFEAGRNDSAKRHLYNGHMTSEAAIYARLDDNVQMSQLIQNGICRTFRVVQQAHGSVMPYLQFLHFCSSCSMLSL